MNAEEKKNLVIGYLKGLIAGKEYYTTLDCRAVREFLKEIEGK